MKTIVISLFVLVGSRAVAQHNTAISRSINDDGKTLSIRVNGTVDGKTIDYDHTFDVASLNQNERNALREHILDSLNVSVPNPPAPLPPGVALAPTAPLAPSAPLAPTPPRPSESVAIINNGQSIISVGGSGENQVVAVGGKNPYTKEVKYNPQSGQMYIRYRFKKDGDDFTYERTIDAPNKSQQERQRIVDDIEKTIGVPVK